MKTNDWTARSTLTSAVLALALALVFSPSLASAQAAGGRGAGMGALQQIRQVMAQLDLSDDQKTTIQGIVKQAMQDARQSMQGLQDATPEDRMAKMQDVQKLIADAKEKVEAELTPAQKAKYYPLMAKAALKQMTDMLAAIKSAGAKQDLSDDLRKQLNDAVDDSQKTVDDFKSDADTVKHADSSKDFQDKLTQAQTDLRKQIVDILGQDDAMKLMQAVRQSMRPTGTGLGGGREARKQTAATQP